MLSETASLPIGDYPLDSQLPDRGMPLVEDRFSQILPGVTSVIDYNWPGGYNPWPSSVPYIPYGPIEPFDWKDYEVTEQIVGIFNTQEKWVRDMICQIATVQKEIPGIPAIWDGEWKAL